MRREIPVLMALAAIAPVSAVAQIAPAAQATVTPSSAEALATARRVAAKLFPPGIYKQMMSSSMEAVTGSMGDAMKALPLRQIAELGGLSQDEAKALDKIDLQQIMTIYDPYWEERQQLMMRAMFGAMGDFFTTMEPELRDGIAHAYANRFSSAELADLDRYFATPTGMKFAANSTTIMTDPAVMGMMKDMMPRMVKQMPAFIAAAQKATASLPSPRKLEQLSPAEKTRLAKAMGVDESKLKDPKSPS